MMRANFHVVTLAEIHRIMEECRETPPPRTVAITFDDCYRDNLAAARVLAEHRLPATFFVPTQYVGTDYVFPWDRHLKKMPNLTWQDVEEMAQLGHEIGSHSFSHPDFGMIGPRGHLLHGLADSKKTLEDRLQRPVRFLAYPYGGRNNFRPEYLWTLARELGYDACFSGHGGFVYPRMLGKVLPRDSAAQFRSLLKLELHLRTVSTGSTTSNARSAWSPTDGTAV